MNASATESTTVRSTCPYCGVGCGVLLSVGGNKPQLQGDPEHPANRGRLCSKGLTLLDTVDLQDRLLYPQICGQRVDWDTALDAVASGFRQVIREYGPQAVAFYVSGQLLTEDYYVANKLMKGFIGTANIDTNSRLCMASSVVGHKRAFGSDTVPGNYQDLELAELVVLVGSNLAWCHPVLNQRLRAAREQNPRLKVVVVDPRRTATCDIADLWLPIRPGSDTLLFNGLLDYLRQHYPLDRERLADTTNGLDEALAAARDSAPDLATVAQGCDIDEEQLRAFYWLFCQTERSVTVYSQGVNQSSAGTDKVNAIINCHLLTDRVGKPGSGPFSVTGQPNAMGGREVGGLANQLAAHMDFKPEDVDRVGRFWQAPNMADGPGLKAVELFQAISRGEIRAVWIMGTNPVVSLPEADEVKQALARCELVVVSDVVADTDTLALAQVKLPALAWGEKDGTVTNSERCISRQRAFLGAPGEARADWWIIKEVACRLGFGESFDYPDAAAIFREHAALSAFENHGTRDFDIGALAALDRGAYDALAPVRWPVPAGQPDGTERLLGEGRCYTPDGRFRFIPVQPRPPVNAPSAAYPLILNTGRTRDHWHTLTRTARSPRLSQHRPEPWVDLHPEDAASLGLEDGMLARLESPWGSATVRARLDSDQQPGSVFVPMHWCAPHAGQARVDALVNAALDPYSGQPESKHTPLRVRVFQPTWQGFLLTREPLSDELLARCDYWVRVRTEHCWRYELAAEEDWQGWVAVLTGGLPQEAMLEYRDQAQGRYRLAVVDGEQLQQVLFIGPDHQLPARDWLVSCFGVALEEGARRSLLSARPASGKDPGPTVCACFGVGRNTLLEAIVEQGLDSPEALGKVLRAGTNCGSCVPELRQLIARVQDPQTA